MRSGAGTPARPSRPCPTRRSCCGDHVAQLDEHLDVERGVLQPGLGQRPRRPVDRGVLLAHRRAEDDLDQGGQADPRVAEQPGRQLGVEEPYGASPTSRRQGRSWLAACRIHSASPIASFSADRSSNAIGSIRAVPDALAAQLDQVGARASSGSRTRARRRARPGRCRTATAGDDVGQRLVGLDDRRADRRAASSRGAGGVSGSAEVAPWCRWSRGRRWALAMLGAPTSAPRCPRRVGHRDHALGHRRQSGRGAEQLTPRLDVRRSSSPAGDPGRADLDLGGGRLVGHAAEALRAHAGDACPTARRTSAPWASSASISQVQPTSASSGSVTISGSIVGARVGDAAEGAVPGVVAGGVVQQDDAAGARRPRRRRSRRPTAPRRTARSAGARASPRRRPRAGTRAARICCTARVNSAGAGVGSMRAFARCAPWRQVRRDLAGPGDADSPPDLRRSAACPQTALRGTVDAALHDSAFLRAARGEPTPHTPVWFMRQAGRSLPEYLKVREGVTMLESCMRPDLVVEITLQPVRRYGVDAAIFFSDIVLPLKAVGVDLDIVAGRRPGRRRTRSGRSPTSRRSPT